MGVEKFCPNSKFPDKRMDGLTRLDCNNISFKNFKLKNRVKLTLKNRVKLTLKHRVKLTLKLRVKLTLKLRVKLTLKLRVKLTLKLRVKLKLVKNKLHINLIFLNKMYLYLKSLFFQ